MQQTPLNLSKCNSWLQENWARVSPSTIDDMAGEKGSLGKEQVKDVPCEGSSHSRNVMLGDSMYSKLDALLSQTQLYSEFLLEKMDNIELVWRGVHFNLAA